MNADENNRIFEFEEKPPQPKSTKASMGIYIFDRKKLVSYLTADEENPDSSNDFGKNIIPAMLNAGEKMYAYPFEGYWKDVGTIQSLWEANMDILGNDPELDLFDKSWRIFSRTKANPPQFIGDGAVVTNSVISEGCEIYGHVENSILFEGVRVEKGASIHDSIIMDGVTVQDDACVEYSIIDSNAVIQSGVKLGETRDKAKGITLIGNGVSIAKEHIIPAGDMVNAAYIEELEKKGEK